MHIHVCVCICMLTLAFVYILYVYLYICVCVYICNYVCVCMHKHINKHKHMFYAYVIEMIEKCTLMYTCMPPGGNASFHWGVRHSGLFKNVLGVLVLSYLSYFSCG